MPSTHIAQKLAEHHIGVGSGHFYALRCVEALGMDPEDGVVRVSMVHYNTVERCRSWLGCSMRFWPARDSRHNHVKRG